MTSEQSNDLLIRLDSVISHLDEKLDSLSEKLDKVEDTGLKTLNQAIKTNGRVTALEKENEYRIAEIKQLHTDFTPIKEKTTSFIHTIKGGWKAIVGSIAVFWIILEKILEYLK